jgi:translation initiation factor 1
MTQRKHRRGLEEQPEGLSHNPFAALGGRAAAHDEPVRDETTSSESPAGPLPERLVVRMERAGRGGKTITRVTGYQGDLHDLQAIARDLKRALGCGASVQGDDLCVQGNVVERVAQHLENLPGGEGSRPKVIRGN